MLVREAEMPVFLEDKLFVDFRKVYETGLAMLAGAVHGLETRELTKALAAEQPSGLIEVRNVLEKAGLAGPVSVGSRDWQALVKILARQGMELQGNRLDLIDPFDGSSTHLA